MPETMTVQVTQDGQTHKITPPASMFSYVTYTKPDGKTIQVPLTDVRGEHFTFQVG